MKLTKPQQHQLEKLAHKPQPTCSKCSKHVRVTARGLYAHHKKVAR